MSQFSHLSEPDPELPGGIPAFGGPGPLTEDLIPIIRQSVEVPLSKRLELYKTRLPSDSAYKLEDHTVAVEDGEIKVRTVSPISTGGEEGQLPVMVYFHGGGWATGDLDMNDFDLRILSVELRLVIVNVDYRLAPEHRFPTGLNDCYAALKWTVENAPKIGGSIEKGFVVCGASAGANLSAVVTHCSLKDPFFEKHKITGQAKLDCLNGPPSDPDLSPLLTDHTGLPPTYLQVCGLDPLRDEGLLYERLLREQGVLTKLDIYPGVPHGFHVMFPGMRAAKKWDADLRQGIKWVLNSSA